MNDENNKYLNEKYGDMIRKFEYKGQQVPFWFECSDGWFDLIDCLCSDIKHYVDNSKKTLDYKKENGETVSDEDYEAVKVTISQVKEKFGGLRFYTYGGDDCVRGMIRFAESMSFKICESCGNQGKLSQKGWWRTLCDSCRADDERKKNEWSKNFERSVQELEQKKDV